MCVFVCVHARGREGGGGWRLGRRKCVLEFVEGKLIHIQERELCQTYFTSLLKNSQFWKKMIYKKRERIRSF